jgi:hypothetical protein
MPEWPTFAVSPDLKRGSVIARRAALHQLLDVVDCAVYRGQASSQRFETERLVASGCRGLPDERGDFHARCFRRGSDLPGLVLAQPRRHHQGQWARRLDVARLARFTLDFVAVPIVMLCGLSE